MAWGGARPGSGRPPKGKRKRTTKKKAAGTALTVPAEAKMTIAQTVAGFDPRAHAMLQSIIETSSKNARGRARTRENNPFRLPDFPKSAIPPGKHGRMALDSAITQFSSDAWLSDAILGSVSAEGLAFPGYAYLSQLAQRAEYRIISETIADDATRKWIKFEVTGTEEEVEERQAEDAADPDGAEERAEQRLEDAGKTDKVKELKDEMERLELRDHFYTLSRDDGFFGRDHLFLDFGTGLDAVAGGRDELKTPIGNGRDALSLGKIEKGSLKSIKTIEPVWTYPQTYNATNPLDRDWYNPQQWYVMGQEIHASRLLRFVSKPVPDMLKPAYAFGGLSNSQIAQPYVDIWLRTRDSVAELIHSFSVMVLMTDMQTLMQPQNAGALLMRAALFNALRDNQGLMLVNKEKEDFKNVQATLSGLDHLQAQAQEHVASIVRIPLVKFTGLQPTGLNASSDGEIRVYYDTIAGYQNRFFRPGLTRVLNFMQLSLWGEIDPEITFNFESLYEMSEKEKGEKQKADAERHEKYVNMGSFDPGEIRKIAIDDPELPYTGLDPDDVPDLQQEEEDGLMPGGKKPGEGGSEKGPGAEDATIIPFVEEADKKTLFLRRPLKNAAQFLAWASEAGFKKTLPASEVHVTIAFSKAPVDWDEVPDAPAKLSVRAGGDRSVKPLGDKGAVVLSFQSDDLQRRWRELCDIGASWDYPTFQPHVTITYDGGDVDVGSIEPYRGPLEFGPEEGSEIKEKWFETAKGALVGDEWKEDDHPRGQPGNAGQFGSGGGSSTEPGEKSTSKGEKSTAGGSSSTPLKMGDLKKVGAQMGSNPGGVYEAESGNRFYVKAGKSADHVKNELIAAKLLRLTGARTLRFRDVEGGKHVATEMSKLDKKNANDFTAKERYEAQQDFIAHAWIANWDAVGLGGDNLGVVKGRPTALDVGGALEYRAQGSSKGKAFGDKVGEIDTLRDRKMNPDSAKMYGDMTPAQLRESARYVTSIPSGKIKAAVEGMGGSPELAAKLIARRDDIAKRARTFGAEGDPKSKGASVVFPAGDALPVKELNGVKFGDYEPPDDWATVEGQADIEEPEFEEARGKKAASGVLIREPDGRVWIVQPKRGFGGYEGTFPKGRMEEGLSMQANAIKEAYEESGLKVKITGFAGDHEGDMTKTRYYYAEREGGDPSQHDDETEGVVLAPPDKAEGFLNRSRDLKVLAGDEFNESKVKRDDDGKFAEQAGSGGEGGGEEKPLGKPTDYENFTEYEKAVAKHLFAGIKSPLVKESFSATVASVLKAPPPAGSNYRRLLTKLIKEAGTHGAKESIAALKAKLIVSLAKSAANSLAKGEITNAKKFGDKMKELGASQDQVNEIVKAAQPAAAPPAPAPKPAPAPEMTPAQKEHAESKEAEIKWAGELAKKATAQAEKKPEPKSAFPPATPQELEKAKKTVKLQLQFVPGAPQTPAAQKLVDKFNEKYAEKPMTTPAELEQKVADFKQLKEDMIPLMSAEQQKAAEAAKAAAAQQAKIDAEAKVKAGELAAKAKAAAKRHADKNAAVMKDLGISESEAEGFGALVKMLGGKTADVVAAFKGYEQKATKYGYPISGFQCALIANYSNGGFSSINAALRSGTWSVAQHVYTKMVNKALAAMPAFTGEVKRGASLQADQQAKYVVGNVVPEMAFTSTASSGGGFGGNTRFHIKAIGKRGASIMKLSNHSSENEVLFQARTHFKVTKVQGKPGGGEMQVWMEELDD